MNKVWMVAGAGALAVVPLILLGGPVAVPHTFVNGTIASAEAINANFDTLQAAINDVTATVASGTTRPTSGLTPGQLFLNTDTRDLDMWDGVEWRTIQVGPTRRSCKEIRQETGVSVTGTYTIKPSAGTPETQVYCDWSLGTGDWTLVSNRRANANNVEACGGNLADFFTNGCGSVTNIGFSDSYALPASIRTQIPFTQILIVGYSTAAVPDLDDAYIMDSSADLFTSVTSVVDYPITQVCDINGTNCDSSDVYFKYSGGPVFFGSARCDENSSPGYGGNYGICDDGISTNYQASSKYGDRDGYAETKLWNYSGAQGIRERIYVR